VRCPHPDPERLQRDAEGTRAREGVSSKSSQKRWADWAAAQAGGKKGISLNGRREAKYRGFIQGRLWMQRKSPHLKHGGGLLKGS